MITNAHGLEYSHWNPRNRSYIDKTTEKPQLFTWNMQFSHSQPPLFSAKLKDEHDQCSYELQILLYCWNLENKNQEQDAQKFNKKCPDNCWKTPQNPMPQRPMLLKISKIIICYRYFLNNGETAITTVLGDKL